MEFKKTKHLSPVSVLAWLSLIGVFAFHLFLIAKYAVDVPYWDDWSSLPVNSAKWIFSFHSEHRIATTRSLVLFLYWIGGWDLTLHQILNFLIYGAVVLLFAIFLAKIVPEWRSWKSAAFGVFLLSPVACENHQWATQTQWHFFLLFTIISVRFLFREKSSPYTLLGGMSVLILDIYSLASGFVAGCILMLLWTGFQGSLARANPKNFQTYFVKWASVFVPVSVALGLYMVGFQRPAEHAPPAMPWTIDFWKYLGEIIQTGLAMPQRLGLQFPLLGIVVLGVFTLLPFFLILFRFGFQKKVSANFWAYSALLLSILGALAAIAVGRGHFPLQTARSGRYAEFTLFLIPLSAAAWHWALCGRLLLQKRFTLLLFAIFAVLFVRSLPTFGQYRANQAARTRDLALIANYYRSPSHSGEFYLPDFWLPLDDYLARAKELNLSFYREVTYSKE